MAMPHPLAKKLRDMQGIAAESCDPEYLAALDDAAREIDRLNLMVEQAESALAVWDEDQQSIYWRMHPERAGEFVSDSSLTKPERS